MQNSVPFVSCIVRSVERGGLGLMAARTRWLNGTMPASAQADSAGVEGSNPEAARMYELKVDDS